MTPLLFAVRDGNVAMTRLLLELGADINQTSGNHTSPLLIALLNGQVALATELLEKGANPNLADDYQRAALFAAIELRNFNHDKYPFLYDDGRDPLDLIKALLEKGADPEPADRHRAGSRADAVRWLVGRTSTGRRRSSARRSPATSR